MKKSFKMISFMFIIIFFTMYGFIRAEEVIDTKPLQDIVSVMNKHNYDITNWSLYTRQKGDTLQTEDEVKKWFATKQKEHEDLQWGSIQQDANGWKITAKNEKEVTEKITFIVYGHKNKFLTYVIYEVYGNAWNKKTNGIVNGIVKERTKRLLLEMPEFFTCIKADVNDKISTALSERANELLADFSAEPIEKLDEQLFLSLSAYNDEWQQSIQTAGKQMNLQIALRKEGLGGKTTVIIGTPIITLEY
jgi:hypothetical protein